MEDWYLFGRKDIPKGFGFIALYIFSQFHIRLNYMNLQRWKVKIVEYQQYQACI